MRKNQEGSAMIMVMFVSVIAVVLSLTLLLAASLVSRYAAGAIQQEQCRITAVTVSELLKDEILSYKYTGQTTADDTHNTSLKELLRLAATPSWPPYNGDEALTGQAVLQYRLLSNQGAGELPGNTVVEFYWRQGTEEGLLADIVLYQKVSNELAGETCTIINCYHPVAITNELKEDEPRGVWEKWHWRYDGHTWEGGET